MGFNRSTVELSTDWAAGNGMEMLTITGTGFGAVQGNGYVTFETGSGYYDADAAANFNYADWSNTSITVEIPQAQSNRVRVVTNDGNTLESADSRTSDTTPTRNHSAPTATPTSTNNGTAAPSTSTRPSSMNPNALKPWSDIGRFCLQDRVNSQLNSAPTSLAGTRDGQNTISFDTPDNPLSPERSGTATRCGGAASSVTSLLRRGRDRRGAQRKLRLRLRHR